MGNGRVRGEQGREEETPKGWSTPHVRNSEKYPDFITDLIGGGDNTDVCPGRQTPSRRHWTIMQVSESDLSVSVVSLFDLAVRVIISPEVHH